MESIFLYILGAVAMLIVIGAPAVMLLIKVQGQLEYDIINIDADKTLDLEYFRQIDKFASRHGYTREMDISVKGLAGENFNRLYTSADGSSILATQMFTQVGNFSTYIEFCSMYDEVDVCVNNAQVSNLLYNPPWSHTIQRPDITEPEKLMSLHRQACAQYGRGAIRRLEASQFASMFQQKHMRNMEYQVERGIFKKDSTGQWYRPRFKLALRGVANYLNPTKDNFSWGKFAKGYLGAVAATAAGWGIFLGTESGAWQWGVEIFDSGDSEMFLAAAMLGMCYAVGGALIGYHFAGKNLVWSLLALATILGGLSWSGMVAPENEILYLFPSTIFLVAAMFIYSLLYKSEKGKYEVVSNALDVVIYVIVFAFLVGWVGLFR